MLSGHVHTYHEPTGRARALYEAALPLSRKHGDRLSVINVLGGLAMDAYLRGDFDHAVAYGDEAVTLSRQGPEPIVPAFYLWVLAVSLLHRGERSRALPLLLEVLMQPVQYADQRMVIGSIECIAGLISNDAPEPATALFGATHAARDRTQFGIALDRRDFEAQFDELRRLLGDEAFAAAWEHGQQMSPAEAKVLALDVLHAL